MAQISIYSQNISGDRHSEELVHIKGMENMTFERRFEKLFQSIPKHVDVIAINEVRYTDRVDFIVKKLVGFDTKAFANNKGDKSFNNMLAVRQTSKWCIEEWKHKWVANGNEPYMADEFTNIEGDEHGRCAGLVYLRHKELKAKVCVTISHVVPFAAVKQTQQNALLSISNVEQAASIPSVIVGDFNRFPDETEIFSDQLKRYGVREAVPSKLVIPGYKSVIETPEDIGTFTPWPNDGIYKTKICRPMIESRLDVHVFTDNQKSIALKSCEVRASMFSDPTLTEPTGNRNKVRHMLDQNMASDHLAVISKFEVLR